jgi:hypothetical protein
MQNGGLDNRAQIWSPYGGYYIRKEDLLGRYIKTYKCLKKGLAIEGNSFDSRWCSWQLWLMMLQDVYYPCQALVRSECIYFPPIFKAGCSNHFKTALDLPSPNLCLKWIIY